jgi:hypothetical protein
MVGKYKVKESKIQPSLFDVYFETEHIGTISTISNSNMIRYFAIDKYHNSLYDAKNYVIQKHKLLNYEIDGD